MPACCSTLHGLLQLPLSAYRGLRLERQYQLSEVTGKGWMVAQLKTALLALGVAVPARAVRLLDDALAQLLVGGCRRRLRRRRCPADRGRAGADPAAPAPLTAAHPRRAAATSRALSARAGVPVIDVHELPLGERSRRASAALVGAGSTRRILLSDTLLADYSDDEIEVVMAHEMGASRPSPHAEGDGRGGAAAVCRFSSGRGGARRQLALARSVVSR